MGSELGQNLEVSPGGLLWIYCSHNSQKEIRSSLWRLLRGAFGHRRKLSCRTSIIGQWLGRTVLKLHLSWDNWVGTDLAIGWRA